MPIAYGNNQLFLAWQGSDEFLNIIESKDGLTFTGKHRLEERSIKSTRPALAFGNGLLFLAWIDHEDRVNIISSQNGKYWAEKVTLSETAHRKASPALAFFNNSLYLAWTGINNKHHINITSFNVSPNGDLAEFAKIILDEESSEEAGPALAATNDQLYLAWQDRRDHINIMASGDGKTFQNRHTLPERSPATATPGIAFADGTLYVSWIGTNDKLNVIASTDGNTWASKHTINEKSTGTGVASIAYGNGTLFLDWSAHEHKHHINVLSFKLESNDGTLPAGTKTVLEEEEEK
jgi:hypothetical protein